MECIPKLYSAPMAEITTPALRSVIRSFCKRTILYSEMISAGALCSGKEHNAPLVMVNNDDPPFIFQLVGHDPAIMKGAASILQDKGVPHLDINMGCPVSAITRKGSGSALLDSPESASAIITACRDVVQGTLSVKLRLGRKDYHREDLLDFIKRLKDAGVDSITLHGRTARMGYKRKSLWDTIKEINDLSPLPLVGNGDILTVEDAIDKMKDATPEGVMIGRGLVASPWLGRDVHDVFMGRTPPPVDREDVFLSLLQKTEELLPENLQVSRALRFSSYYTRQFFFGHQLFTDIRKEESIKGMIHIVKNYFKHHEEEKVHT